jgi:hypothetical protein
VNNKKDSDLTLEKRLERLCLKDQKTQLGRVMGELGVDTRPAHSPQAKGRVVSGSGELREAACRLSSSDMASRLLRPPTLFFRRICAGLTPGLGFGPLRTRRVL